MNTTRRGFLTTSALAVGGTLASACAESPAKDFCATDPCEPVLGMPSADYFTSLSEQLQSAEYGTPQIVIDLDRLEANARAIAAGIGRERYRIVEKSLPSFELIEFIQQRTGTNRLMVMHLPFLPGLLQRFPAAEIMLGKPQATLGVKRLFREVGAAASRASFLVDSVTRFDELRDLARQFLIPLSVTVELDIGMHRGGVQTTDVLDQLLTRIEETANVTLLGFSGYDGHVIEAPAAPGLKETTCRKVFAAAQEKYAAFVSVLRDGHPRLMRDDLRFNCGGTSTYHLYTSGPVNDVATGGGMLRPREYDGTFISALSPAMFIASPVLTQLGSIALPLVKTLSSTLFTGEVFTACAAGHGGAWVFPDGLDVAPLTDGPEDHNVPNQGWLVMPDGVPAPAPGSFIFRHPAAGDALFGFEDILLVRDGTLTTEKWHPFTRRF